MPGMYGVQNIFHNYMSNLSNKEMPFFWNSPLPCETVRTQILYNINRAHG